MSGPEAVESRVRSMLGGKPEMAAAEPDADDLGEVVDPEQMTLEAGSADLIAAVQAGDPGAVSRAFRSMFEALMSPTE